MVPHYRSQPLASEHVQAAAVIDNDKLRPARCCCGVSTILASSTKMSPFAYLLSSTRCDKGRNNDGQRDTVTSFRLSILLNRFLKLLLAY